MVTPCANPDKETELDKLTGVVLLPLDVTDPVQIKTAVDRVIALGEADVVFNNAGYGMAGPLEGLTDEQIVRMIDTNMLGAIRTTKAFIPYFRLSSGYQLYIAKPVEPAELVAAIASLSKKRS